MIHLLLWFIYLLAPFHTASQLIKPLEQCSTKKVSRLLPRRRNISAKKSTSYAGSILLCYHLGRNKMRKKTMPPSLILMITHTKISSSCLVLSFTWFYTILRIAAVSSFAMNNLPAVTLRAWHYAEESWKRSFNLFPPCLQTHIHLLLGPQSV